MSISKREADLDHAYCVLHNEGQTLAGNTQASDLEWFGRLLFERSELGAGWIKTIPWLLTREQYEYLGLQRQGLFETKRWDMLTDDQREAWRKIARITLSCLPDLASRIAHRYEVQAAAIKNLLKEEWANRERNQDAVAEQRR